MSDNENQTTEVAVKNPIDQIALAKCVQWLVEFYLRAEKKPGEFGSAWAGYTIIQKLELLLTHHADVARLTWDQRTQCVNKAYACIVDTSGETPIPSYGPHSSGKSIEEGGVVRRTVIYEQIQDYLDRGMFELPIIPNATEEEAHVLNSAMEYAKLMISRGWTLLSPKTPMGCTHQWSISELQWTPVKSHSIIRSLEAQGLIWGYEECGYRRPNLEDLVTDGIAEIQKLLRGTGFKEAVLFHQRGNLFNITPDDFRYSQMSTLVVFSGISAMILSMKYREQELEIIRSFFNKPNLNALRDIDKAEIDELIESQSKTRVSAPT